MGLNFDRKITDLAQELVGARLLVRGVGGTVIETEAYALVDPASHSFCGPTPRNAPMFGPPGTVYVYLSYGCHLCLNVVGRSGDAVLIRALRPEFGVDVMRERRGDGVPLAAGPGRVGQALGIALADNGKQFGDGEFVLVAGPTGARLLTGPRIGISRATDLPWRFGLAGAGGISRPFPADGRNISRRREQFLDPAIDGVVPLERSPPMPNAPGPAAQKRTPPLTRQNAQDDSEGAPYRPEDFDAVNPARQGLGQKPAEARERQQTGGHTMPAISKAQQRAAGAALAAKRGETAKSDLKGASKDMERSMTEKELEELASTQRKSLPERKG